MSKIKSFIKFKVLGLISLLAFMLVIDEGMNPKELHEFFLNNSPYKETQLLNRSERKAEGLPPNQYHEQLYDLSLNPTTGIPDYSSKLEAQQQIERDKDEVAKYAVPGESPARPWYEVGPKNHSGRTRAAVWDQTDGAGKRVIAGGVSGGLWKNNDITNSTSQWTRISGVPGNLAVSVIVQDEDNPNLLYVGTGENYTNGDAFGNGIYKSTNGGDNWTLVFGRGASTTVTNTGSSPSDLRVEGFFSVNDIALYDHDKNPGTEPQVFAGLSSVYHYRRSTGFGTWTDENVVGLWKSTDGELGNWSRIGSVNNGSGRGENVNDIEVQEVSNRIWLSSQKSALGSSFGLGGRFWYSDDGITFTKANPTFPAFPSSGVNDRKRTEIASSHQNTDTHYIVIETSGTASGTIPVIYKTTDNFTTFSYIEPPLDKDTGIPDEDYTRGQSFYDLEIEVDPFNDQILYVGGIDWFRSQNAGSDWSQITKWSNNNLLSTLDCSVVHADQHGLYFKPGPGNSNEAIVVNDGGVYYSSSLSTASDTSTFTEMEKNMITTQFYAVAQSPTDFAGADWIIGGTQDNGTYSVMNSNQNKTDGTEIQTGDGGDTFFDQVGGHYYISSYVRNNKILRGNFDALGNIDINLGWGGFEAMNNGIDNLSSDLGIPDGEGSFINPAALDSNQDVYFSNAGDSGGANSIRVITGLERGGTPATFLIPSVSTGADFVTALEVSPFTTDRTTLFVGLKSGEVKKITNAQSLGLHVITPVYSQLGSVSDIQFGDNENEIYLTYYNYGLNAANYSNIRYTNDGFAGGVSSNKEGDLPDIPVLTILNNPFEDDEVIVGTDLGVWRTANFSAANPNWTSAYTGMQDVAVRDLDYRGVSALDNRVLAASYGRGVFVGSFSSNSNPPISTTDSITVIEGGTVTTTTGGATSVLSNDSDPDGDPITTDLVSTTLNGTLTLSPSGTGSFTYTHNDTETTTDTFWYRANDGSVFGNTVSVTINITPVNECPIVQNPLSNITVPEDSIQEQIPITNVFDDPEGSTLSYTVTNTNPSLLNASIASTLGFPVTHTLLLDYQADATGTATITIFANDSGCGSLVPHEFFVTVNSDNDLPVGVSDTVTVTEGGTVTTTTALATSVLFNDTDVDVDNLTIGNGFGAIAPSVSKGSLTLLNNGTFSYTHDGTQNPGDITTNDSFLYRPFDAQGFGNTTTVTIQIFHTNDCPIVNIPINDFNAIEDDPDLDIDISSVFSDEENDAITLTVSSTNLALLSATKSSATTLTIDYVDNMIGSSTIILYATDNTIECSSLVSSSFVITVVPENDTPVGNPDTITVDEGGTVSSTTISNTVLANDTDTERDALTATLVPGSGPFNHLGGAFSLKSSGTFEYNHDGSETITDTFTYRLSDSLTSTDVLVTININSINDCPEVFTPLPDISVNEDAADTVIDLSPYFSDAENNPLSFSFTNADPTIANVIL
ncbi:MAG: Ig-like domain-containing protein, partial [Flavobacteriaceae bacterium]|nr:Ig-like domain-containing protein [Flavobacteriaceae bacterium]